MLSDERIKKLQKIYRERFGVELSREEAIEKGLRLRRDMRMLYVPMTKSELEIVKKRRNEIVDNY
jgi:hypothetical protein